MHYYAHIDESIRQVGSGGAVSRTVYRKQLFLYDDFVVVFFATLLLLL